MAAIDFDATKENASNCIPAGEYDLCISKCELKVTSGGRYQAMQLEMKVLNGEFQNRAVFASYMFAWIGSGAANSKEQQAIDIGRGRFGAICKAVAVPSPKTTEELLGKTFHAKLKIRKSDEYGDQNEIQSAKPRAAGAVTAPAAGGKW